MVFQSMSSGFSANTAAAMMTTFIFARFIQSRALPPSYGKYEYLMPRVLDCRRLAFAISAVMSRWLLTGTEPG